MTHDPNRIEIAADGVVTRGGRKLGVMTFESLSAQWAATGEHFPEGVGPDEDELDELRTELEETGDERDEARSDLFAAERQIERVRAACKRALAGETFADAASLAAAIERIL